ncbi:histidine kinase [Devosia soli]|uniref:Histidine kinase n=1 Tax=Devosia soli TaxID=361041 RepID=A0A0F5LDS8_9HYPH|nr:response regulator [Devosia soli]KKB80354.1 histidine kinase [Devosia soli]
MRIFYLEDNPLIAFHVEQLVEDLGHTYVGSLDSFKALKLQFENYSMDVALIDVDLADGRTGPHAARWLKDRKIPCLFLTGQDHIAADAGDIALGTISKPVSLQSLADGLLLVPE